MRSDWPVACWRQGIVQFRGCAHAHADKRFVRRRGPARPGLSATLRIRRGLEVPVCLGGVSGEVGGIGTAAVMTSERFESSADARSYRGSALEPGHPLGRVAQSVA